MAIKIRRRSYDEPQKNQSASIELNQLWAQRSADSNQRFGLNQVRVVVEFSWPADETPLEPFHQIDILCASCRIIVYRSANDIDFCLACGRLVDEVTAPRSVPRRPQTRARKKGPVVTRTFKVQAAKKPPAPPPPKRSWMHSLPDYVQSAITILDIGADSMTVELVRKRRQDLALVHHPDIGGDTDRFASINAAADLLISYLDS